MANFDAARALGWTSIALGAAVIAAPGWLDRQLGVSPGPTLWRALGARELASAAGILARRDPTAGLWSRVAGDAMDLALLGVAARASRRRGGVAVAAAMVAGLAALDLWQAESRRRARRDERAAQDAGAGI